MFSICVIFEIIANFCILRYFSSSNVSPLNLFCYLEESSEIWVELILLSGGVDLKSELCWVGVSGTLQRLIFSLQRYLKQNASNNDNFLPPQSSCHRLWVIHRHPTVYQSHCCNARTWVRQSTEQTVNNVNWDWIWILMLLF